MKSLHSCANKRIDTCAKGSVITLVHGLQAERLLFAWEGRDHQAVVDFGGDLKAHGPEPAQVNLVYLHGVFEA